MKIINDSIVNDKLLKEASIIINPTNPYMISGSGISRLIFQKAGKDELEKYCKEKYKTNMKVSEVRVTKGFDIPLDILFVQGPKRYDYKTLDEAVKVLLQTCENLLDFCIENNYKSILLPSLGTGVYGFKHEDVAEKVLKLLTSEQYKLLDIKFVIYDKSVYIFYKNKLEELK